MSQNIINKLFADTANRVDHITAVLKNHRNLSPTHFTPLLRRIIQQVSAVKNDIAAAYMSITRQTAHNSTYHRCFTAAALANDR